MPDTPVNPAEMAAVAWRACDIFRGIVDPSEYRNYVLVFWFWKFLSDVGRDQRGRAYSPEKAGQPHPAYARFRDRFTMPEGCDFYALALRRNLPDIGHFINDALRAIEQANQASLGNVLTLTDFNSETRLGQSQDRNARLRELFEVFADARLDMRRSQTDDQNAVGDAYELLIERFAAEDGRKSGEFYTPRQVSQLLAKLLQPRAGETICDPLCGSGSLLVWLGREVESADLRLFGQESNGSAWALCRMNLILHGMDDARIEWGDSIRSPRLIVGDRLMRFDVVAADPPLASANWGEEFATHDPFRRFHRGVPPRSRGDWGFISHLLETATEDRGRVGVIVPHGVLFRGGVEEDIRRSLVEEKLLEAVISLPAKLFFGTGIPAAILLFNKAKPRDGDVLFVDASRGHEDGKGTGRLSKENTDRIVATYERFATMPKHAHRARPEEIAANGWNWNVPRYVDTAGDQPVADLQSLRAEIKAIEAELVEKRREIAAGLQRLKV